MSSTDIPRSELSFEKAVSRLEEIVAALEDDQLDLESSLKAYEEGVELARLCLKRLDAAELRIQEISLDDDD
jgi:exodeoxyribonuclease VII small subunit